MTKHIKLNIKVMLNTNFGKVQIGEISLNPSVMGSISEEYIVEQWFKNVNVNVQQIARVWTQAENRSYLYGVHYHNNGKELYEFYYVSRGMLYDDHGYLEEIEVGEFLGDLTTLDQATALDAFMVKIKEELS
jgi:hypothetical protein